MDAYRNVVVTVDGGGVSVPGASLRALAATLPGPPGSYQRADLVLGGDLYPRLVSAAPALPDLIEVSTDHPPASPSGWARALRRLLGLIMGLPAVRFDWCEAAPAVHTPPAYRDLVQGALLWSAWPVLLTLVHTVVLPVARTNGLLLDVLLIGLLALLARSQWRFTCRVTAAGYAWLGLCLGLVVGLWIAPQWTALATTLSIRVYGLAQLVAAVVLLALTVEIVTRIFHGRISCRCGLAGLSVAALPLLLLSLVGAGLWALGLNALLAVGSPPALEAFRAWQQTYAATLGYHLASVEWAGAALTTLVAALVLGGGWHGALAQRGETTRRWFAVVWVVLPVGAVLLSLYMLLTAPYLGAPLAKLAQRWGAAADVTTIYTWSALRLLPWLLLLATPNGRLLGVFSEVGFYLMPDHGPGLSSRQATCARLGQLLRFLDRGRYDRIHVLARRQGAIIALDVLRTTDASQPLTLTTFDSPAGPLYGDLLDWPPADVGSAEWRNLFRQDDPLGGPVGAAGVDLPLGPDDRVGVWSDAGLAERVIEVMRAPLPAPPGSVSIVR